jgi:type I restriction enzyme R subunit
MRLKNILTTFADFSFEDVEMGAQEFEDYKSKYLDIYDKVKSDNTKEKESILNDVDFELELIHRDEINVLYILQLLAKLKSGTKEEQARQRKQIEDYLTGELQLRSKRQLIEKFISENLPYIEDTDTIAVEFESFLEKQKQKALEDFCKDEKLKMEKLQEIIGNYLFTERTPLPDEIVEMLVVKPKILERKTIVERVTDKILDFVETYITGMAS